MVILIAGGTGLLGNHLSRMLKAKGYAVNHLSRQRNLNTEFPAYKWDLHRGFIEAEAIEQADYVINLAGAGVADKRWTASRKQLIIDSRVKSTLLLKKYLEQRAAQGQPISAYIAASAIGFYGNRGDELLTEDAPPGEKGFLPKSVIAWENAIREVQNPGIRTVALRIGIVLSTQGGALEKLMLPFKFFCGVYFGDGRQWYSWIHIDDLCRMFIEAIENKKLKGFYNAVAPHPARNKDLAFAIKKALERPAMIIPAPAFALRAVMGEMAEMILDGAKVSSEKIMNAGFTFQHPELLPALKDLLARKV